MVSFRFAPPILAAIAVAVGATAFALKAPAQTDDEYFGLPEGKGREEITAYCAACHSLRLVSQQRLPRYRWEELLVLMNEKHGMPKLPPEDEKIVTDYLAEKLGPPPRRRRF